MKFSSEDFSKRGKIFAKLSEETRTVSGLIIRAFTKSIWSND